MQVPAHQTFQFRTSAQALTHHPAPSVESKALPLEWLLNPDKERSQVDRILARLMQAEAHETDVWLRDDYRQAFITVSFAAKGSAIPFVEASYLMYGLHPDKLYPAILARRAALLGDRPDIVQNKKPAHSVTQIPQTKERTK